VSRVEQLENTVRALTPEELREFRVWLDAWDSERWDRQFTTDVIGGKLDAIADRALKDLAENRATDL
jgi:hypothetical protein